MDYTQKAWPLFPSQLWILRNIPPGMRWNISYMLFSGSGYACDALRLAIDELVETHNVFKLRFYRDAAGVYYQQPGPDSTASYLFRTLEIPQTNNRQLLHTEMEKLQQSLDIQKGPLLAVGLFKTREGDHLYIVTHHLISDAYSFKLLIKYLASGYQARLQQKPARLRHPPSFLEAVDVLYQYAAGETLGREIEYWQKIVLNAGKPLRKDKAIKQERRIEQNSGDIHRSILKTSEYAHFKKRLRDFQIAKYDYYVSLIGLSLCDWNESGAILLKLFNHGRTWDFSALNLSQPLGPFWYTYPVLIDNRCRGNTPERVHAIEQMLKQVPSRGRGYEVLREIRLKDDQAFIAGDNRNPNIFINYYGKVNEQSLLAPGLGSVSPCFKDFNRHPQARCPFDLVFNLREIDRSLRVQIIYNKLEYEFNSIGALYERIRQNLQANVTEMDGRAAALAVTAGGPG